MKLVQWNGASEFTHPFDKAVAFVTKRAVTFDNEGEYWASAVAPTPFNAKFSDAMSC